MPDGLVSVRVLAGGMTFVTGLKRQMTQGAITRFSSGIKRVCIAIVQLVHPGNHQRFIDLISGWLTDDRGADAAVAHLGRPVAIVAVLFLAVTGRAISVHPGTHSISVAAHEIPGV
jgi:hypothetical protein